MTQPAEDHLRQAAHEAVRQTADHEAQDAVDRLRTALDGQQ